MKLLEIKELTCRNCSTSTRTYFRRIRKWFLRKRPKVFSLCPVLHKVARLVVSIEHIFKVQSGLEQIVLLIKRHLKVWKNVPLQSWNDWVVEIILCCLELPLKFLLLQLHKLPEGFLFLNAQLYEYLFTRPARIHQRPCVCVYFWDKVERNALGNLWIMKPALGISYQFIILVFKLCPKRVYWKLVILLFALFLLLFNLYTVLIKMSQLIFIQRFYQLLFYWWIYRVKHFQINLSHIYAHLIFQRGCLIPVAIDSSSSS